MKLRTPTRRFVVATGLSSVLLPGVAWPQSDGREVEGGIGGTGIVGVLVDFGSIFVAGYRVETDASTQVLDSYGRLSVGDLRVGDALTVEAATLQSGTLIARRVHVTYPLVGPVTSVADGGRRLTINGVDVVSEARQPASLTGQRVAVSGLWQGSRVVASRIASARDPRDLISGTLDRLGARNTIGGLPARGPSLLSAGSGSFATLLGRFDPADGRFVGDRSILDRFTGAAGPLGALAVEGWLEPTRQAPGFRVAGLGHSFTRNLQLDQLQNQRLLLRGGYDGRFAVNDAVRLPASPNERRQLLRRMGDT